MYPKGGLSSKLVENVFIWTLIVDPGFQKFWLLGNNFIKYLQLGRGAQLWKNIKIFKLIIWVFVHDVSRVEVVTSLTLNRKTRRSTPSWIAA